MSNLIIMPDATGAFSGEDKVLASYAGRCLALNLDKIKVFQTHKFYLGPKRPFATVMPDADQISLRNAVLDGRLIDVTDQKGKGIKLEGGDMSPIAEIPDAGLRKVFIGVGRTDQVTPAGTPRPLFVAVPGSEEEEAAMLAELERTGRIDGTYTDSEKPDVEFGGISVSDVEPRRYIANTKRETSFSLLVKAIKLVASDIWDFLPPRRRRPRHRK
jgi:hypothetical protein